MFNKIFILKDTLVLPQFAKALLSFEQITHIKKKIRNICEIGKN